jgi:signal peptidase I
MLGRIFGGRRIIATASKSSTVHEGGNLKLFGYELSESAIYFLKALQLVGVLYCVKTYGVDFNTTWGASMSPLIREDGNVVLVDKITPRFTGWKKGDIVVAAVPTDGHLVLKRICGMPGEAVPVDRLGKRTITVPQDRRGFLVIIEELRWTQETMDLSRWR